MSLTAAAAWPKLTACSRHARFGAKEIAAAEPYRLSYSKGPNTPELMTVCIDEVLDRTASLYPDKRAVVMRHTGSRFTWSELRDEVERAARGLLALGVKGDRVGIWAKKLHRMGADPVRYGEDRGNPGQHQPAVPLDAG